jgi:hypothetical protein
MSKVFSMSKVNNVRWSDLEDAYGKAGKVPELLHQAIADTAPEQTQQSGPWSDLWSRLYHQGSVFSASYAALPVIVNAIKMHEKPIPVNFFLLPVCIELARIKTDAPKMPDYLKEDYDIALKELGTIAAGISSDEISDQYMKKSIQAAQLIASNKYAEASELIEE